MKHSSIHPSSCLLYLHTNWTDLEFPVTCWRSRLLPSSGRVDVYVCFPWGGYYNCCLQATGRW